MVGLTIVRNPAEAAVVCGMLQSNGIACTYRQTSFGAGTMDGVPGGGAQEILVPESELDKARYLLGEEPEPE